jgi:hypothetical protein
MDKDMIKYIIGKRFPNDSEVERRINIYDRRKLSTYIVNDRRSGAADRRATITELISKYSFRDHDERRCGKSDRRELNTCIKDDRRSGIHDRRSGS